MSDTTKQHDSTTVVQEDILKELNLDKTEEQTESTQSMPKSKERKIVIIASIVAIIAGMSTGFGVHRLTAGSQEVSTGPADSNLQQVAEGTVKAGDVFGIKDEDTFTDSAEGYLVEAGLDEEGSHKLLRPGGETQTVYLTSSTTDLDKFVGMEIAIKGETFKGQNVGWLMDVGQVKVVAVDGEEPSEF